MNLHSIRWRLPLSYIAIALMAALASGALMLTVLRDFYQKQEREYLERNADQIARAAEQLIQAGVPDLLLDDQLATWSFLLRSRVQVYSKDGILLADSGTPDAQQVLMVSNLEGGGPQFNVSIQPGAVPLSSTVPLESPGLTSGIFLVQAPPPGAKNDIVFLAGCPNEDGAPCSVGVASGQPITGTSPITQPIAVSMPLTGSFFGFKMDAAPEVSQQQPSQQRVDRELLDTSGNLVGKLVVSEGPAYGAEILASVARAWAAASLIALTLAGAVGWLTSRRITAPLLHLTNVTGRMAQGDLSARSDAGTDDEFGRLGRSFDQMAEQIERLVGALRRFVADAAHELNTPITALQTDLELARTAANPGEQARLMDQLAGQIGRMRDLVRNLLDLSRLEGKTSAPIRQKLDLVKLVQSLAEVYASRAEQAEIEFELELPEDPVILSGDPAQLQVAIENLLDNALKFTPPGGVVRLRLEYAEHRAILSIEDTGIGILTDDLPSLFQRFHRGRNASAYPGNGLGLAIVDQIARLHGGSVTAINTSPGTRFILRLPAD